MDKKGGIDIIPKEITTKIGSGKVIHAASYDKENKTLGVYCDSLKFDRLFVNIVDEIPPTKKTVTCKKCLKIMEESE